MSRPAALLNTSKAQSNAGSLEERNEMRTLQGDLSPDLLTVLYNILTEQAGARRVPIPQSSLKQFKFKRQPPVRIHNELDDDTCGIMVCPC